jgi:restriction system protein
MKMAIPGYQVFLLPLLEALADGGEHHIRDLTEKLTERFHLSDEERSQLLPSGQQTVVANRVAWVRTYLKKAGLLESPSRGRMRITRAGRDVVGRKLERIDRHFLERYPSFVEFIEQQAEPNQVKPEPDSIGTPEESLETAYATLRRALADELLDRLKRCSPQFFERLVVEVLVAMGYGGSLSEAGHSIGRTGDGGIDGIIKEDRLGLDVVCIQAKRWENTVGRPVVQSFAGSMEGFRARKGVLITTARFSKDAYDYVKHIERKIILIDGPMLAELMIDHDVGVTHARSYVVKKIDLDYFSEELG